MIVVMNQEDERLSLPLLIIKERFGEDNIKGKETIRQAKVVIYSTPKDLIENARINPSAYHILLAPSGKKHSFTIEELQRQGMNTMISTIDALTLVKEIETGLTHQPGKIQPVRQAMDLVSTDSGPRVIKESLDYGDTFEAVREALKDTLPGAGIKEIISWVSKKYDGQPFGVRTPWVKHAYDYINNNKISLKEPYDGHPAPMVSDKSFVNIVKRPAAETQKHEIISQAQPPAQEENISAANNPEPVIKYPYKFDPTVDLSQFITEITHDGKVQLSGLKNNYIIGTSPATVNLLFQIKRAIMFENQDILILGENGTGKDLVMKIIGENSFKIGKTPKGEQQEIKVPMEIINIGAESDELFRSALMGHERGAFTDAKEPRKGYLRNNPNSALGIDEIGDVSPVNQSTLLRVIENREGHALGADTPYFFNKRLVFATNKDISELRIDLAQRLTQCVIQIPPLRERTEDIGVLAEFFINKANERYPDEKKTISPAALQLLSSEKLDWPGNIRELGTTITRAFIFELSGEIKEQSIISSIQASRHESKTNQLEPNHVKIEKIIHRHKQEYEVVDSLPELKNQEQEH